MKRLLVSVLILVFSATSLWATGESDNFFYTLGFRDGYTKGFMEGYRRAWMERGIRDKGILDLYVKQFEALEAGKYLLKEGLITYPRIYKMVTKDGRVIFKIEGCKAEEPLKLSDLMKVSRFVPNMLEVCSICTQVTTMGNPEPPKWTAPVVPGVANYGKLGGELGPIAVYKVEVKQKHLSLLDQNRIPYISVIEDGKEKYYAVFTDKKMLKAFCDKHEGVCGKVHINNVTTKVRRHR